MLILETLRSKGVQESPIILYSSLFCSLMSLCLDQVQWPEKGLPVAGKMAKFCKKWCPDGVLLSFFALAIYHAILSQKWH